MSGENYMAGFLVRSAPNYMLHVLAPLFRGSGSGALSGSSPDGLVTRLGAPVEADIQVRIRMPGSPFDGTLVAATISEADGTWEITGLDTGLRYDVVGRYAAENDVVASDVTPI